MSAARPPGRPAARRRGARLVMVNLPSAGVDYHVPLGGRKGSSHGPRERAVRGGVPYGGEDGIHAGVAARLAPCSRKRGRESSPPPVVE